MRAVLLKLNAPIVTDVQLLQHLFNAPELRMVDEYTYVRPLPTGSITETVFGNPTVRRK
jgi:hypothetical protein